MTTPAALNCNYASLVNRLGWQQFGLRPNPTSGDVITQGIANANQAQDILNCIQDGLAVVYNAWRWSFLRPQVPITTYAPYTTDTIIMQAGTGLAVLNNSATPSDGGFPTYSASAGGQLWIGTAVPTTFYGGTFNVSAWNSATSLTLQNTNGTTYSGPAFPATTATGSAASTNSAPGTTFTWGTPTTASAGQYVIVYAGTGSVTPGAYLITAVNGTTSCTLSTSPGASLSNVSWGLAATGTGIAYTLYFNNYPLPAGFNTFENELTYPASIDQGREPLQSVDEVMIRRYLERDNVPHKPRMYAEVANTFVPTVGSTKTVMFYPIPDAQYILTGKAVLQQVMLDNTNIYPLGVDVLAPAIMESVLAAAERNLDQIHPGSPEAVHNAALQPILAMAIQRDKEYGSPDTLGIDHGQEGDDGPHRHHRRSSSIFWNAGGHYDGYL